MNSGNGKVRDWCIQVARLPQCLRMAHPLRDDEGDVEGPPEATWEGEAGGCRRRVSSRGECTATSPLHKKRAVTAASRWSGAHGGPPIGLEPPGKMQGGGCREGVMGREVQWSAALHSIVHCIQCAVHCV